MRMFFFLFYVVFFFLFDSICISYVLALFCFILFALFALPSLLDVLRFVLLCLASYYCPEFAGSRFRSP